MVELGQRPILWHIMKIYGAAGVKNFIILAGYKSQVIKDYFHNFALHNADVLFSVGAGKTEIDKRGLEDWRVRVLETGLHTETGGRLLYARPFLENDQPFFMTYGDGLANVNLNSLLDFHTSQRRLATLTAAQAPARFGALEFAGANPSQEVMTFREKPQGEGSWVNAGYFVLQPDALDYVADKSVAWEGPPLSKLASESNLVAYKHSGFWQPMDTLRDRDYLNSLWESGEAPWKVW